MTFCTDYDHGELVGVSIFQKQKKIKNQQFILSDKVKVLRDMSSRPGFPKKKNIKEILEYIESGQKIQNRILFQNFGSTQTKNG